MSLNEPYVHLWNQCHRCQTFCYSAGCALGSWTVTVPDHQRELQSRVHTQTRHRCPEQRAELGAEPKCRPVPGSAELGPRITFTLSDSEKGFSKVKAVDVFLWLSCLSCLLSFSSKQCTMAGCPYTLQIILSVLHPDTTRDNL